MHATQKATNTARSWVSSLTTYQLKWIAGTAAVIPMGRANHSERPVPKSPPLEVEGSVRAMSLGGFSRSELVGGEEWYAMVVRGARVRGAPREELRMALLAILVDAALSIAIGYILQDKGGVRSMYGSSTQQK